MNTFFCDIRGTFDGEENRDELVRNFVSLLTSICIKLEIKDLVFRFITTDDVNYLLPYIKEMEKYFEGTPIRLTSQFAGNKRYKYGKIEELPFNNKLDEMKYILENRGVERIFYADDANMNQIMAQHILPRVVPDVEMISFIPNSTIPDSENIYHSQESGLKGLIESIKKYDLELTKKQSKTL